MQLRTLALAVAAIVLAACTSVEVASTTRATTTEPPIATTIVTTTSTAAIPETTTQPSPCGDVYLDALYDACDLGDWEACDELFRNAPDWSACERFGDTCGMRTTTPRDARCQDLYAGIDVPASDWPGLPED